VNVVVTGVAPLRAVGLVRPNHVAVTVGDSEDVFAVRRTDQNQTLGLGRDGGE